MSESVPTSVTSFAHRRGRTDSTASFTYFQEDEATTFSDEEAVIDEYEEDSSFEDGSASVDLEAAESLRRISSARSRSSVNDRLLRSDSARTDASGTGRSGRPTQKIHILDEDLTIVVAGFRTSTFGFAIYITLCTITFGLAYLIFRWLPRWRVRLIGSAAALRDCAWVVIEVSIRHAYWFWNETKQVRINGANLLSKIYRQKTMGGPFLLYLDSPRRSIPLFTTKTMILFSTSCDSSIIAI